MTTVTRGTLQWLLLLTVLLCPVTDSLGQGGTGCWRGRVGRLPGGLGALDQPAANGPPPLPPLEVQLHDNGLLELTLARPKRLNALDMECLELLNGALDEYAGAATGVLLNAVPGRAFCAGGDVRHVAALEPAAQRRFLHLEYSVHSRLQHAAVPVVAVGDGIVMGAGAGLFMAAGARVATEQILFAMPEANIALCPDAGALHFLNQVTPPAVGLWMAVTGARLGPRDTMDSGLGTHFVPSAAVEQLTRELRTMPVSEAGWLLQCSSETCTASPGVLGTSRPLIDRCFTPEHSTAEELTRELEAELARVRTLLDSCGWRTREQAEAETDALAEWLASIDQVCPTAVAAAVFGMQLSREHALTADAARAVEFLLNTWLAARPDFAEGVACAVGHRKGDTPRWHPGDRRHAADADGFLAVQAAVRAAVRDGTVLQDLGSGGTARHAP